MWRIYLDEANQYRWRITDLDGSVLGQSSVAFDDRTQCRDAMDRVAQTVFASMIYGGIAEYAVREDSD